MLSSRFVFRTGACLSCKVLGIGRDVSYAQVKESKVILTSQIKRFAGHSHWQNVKSFKEAQDKEKSRITALYVRLVNKAIKDGNGQRDPKLNQRLASVLADAKANSVSSATLEKVLKQDLSTDPYLVEVQAQGGLFILVESRAKPITTEKQKIAALVKKFGCSVSQSTGTITKEFFDHIGLVIVARNPNIIPDLDAALNLGIEVGATDVQRSLEDDQEVYHFHCPPNEVNQLRTKLEEHNVDVLEAEDVFVPKLTVTISAEVKDNLNLMYERIKSQHDQVNRIFDNTTCDDKA